MVRFKVKNENTDYATGLRFMDAYRMNRRIHWASARIVPHWVPRKIPSKVERIIAWLLFIILFWIVATCFIQAFKCPQMTQMEFLLHIPESIVLNWENCN